MGKINLCGKVNTFSKTRFVAVLPIRLMILSIFFLAGLKVQSQVLIAQEGFNNTTSIFTITGGVYYSGITGGGVKPPGANNFFEGTASYGVKNGTAVLTSSTINTGSFGNNSVSFRLSAHGNGMGNGVDNLDFVRVEISTDGGTNYTQYIQIVGDVNSSYWDFDAAGIASTNYPTAINLVSPNGNASSPAFSGLNTGYGTVLINDIPTTTSLRVRITLFNNKNQKDWLVDDFRVTGYNLPQVSSFTGNEYCSGGTGMLTITTNSGTGPFTVVYNDGSSNQTVSNISSGVPFNATPNPASTTNYTLVSVTDVNNATRYTGFTDADATITVNMPPVVSAGIPFTKSCIQNINGALIGETAETGFSYSWSPSTGLSAGNVGNPLADPTTTTTYTVTKTNDLTGCFSSASVTVTVDNEPLPVDAGQPFTKTCVLNASGALIGESNDPTATYSWSPSLGLSLSTVSNPLANPASTTLYTLTKTRISNGCTSVASVLVTVDTEAPIANAGNDFTITCIENVTGALIGEASEANSSYSWMPSAGLSDPSVSDPLALPSTTTIYTLTRTNTINGCSASDQVTVTVSNDIPVVDAGSPFTKTCISNINGAMIGEVADPAATYSWSPSVGLSSSTVSNPVADPLVTTTYILTKTIIATGCEASASVTVTVDQEAPTAGITNNMGATELTCSLTSINVTASGGVSYAWNGGNPGATDADRVFTLPGTYTVTVTAANGCTDTESIIITQDITDPVAIINNNSGVTEITCTLSTISVTASGGVSYSWNGGATGATDADRLFTAPGTYTVIVTAANGCTDTESITITQSSDIPVALITNNTGTTELTCSVTEISVTASGGVSYSWNGGNAGVTDADRTFTSPGTYIVTVTAANGCTDTESITITQNIIDPVATLVNNSGTTELTCAVNSISVTAEGGQSYSWDGGTPGATDADRTFNTPGTYTVTVTTANGCIDTESIIITQNIIDPVAAITNNSGTTELTCAVTIISVSASGGQNYSWDGGTPGATDADRNFTTPGTYTVTVTAANGCTDTESITITQNIIDPVATITNNTGTTELNCTVTSITVTAFGDGTFAWDGGAAGNTNSERIITTPGTYTVTVTATNGCTDTESITITQNIIDPVATINNNTGTTELTCSVTSISVTASGGGTYVWDGGTAGTTDADRTFSTPGTYTVTVTTANGCTDTESIFITQNIIDPVAGINNNTGTTELTCVFTSISVTATGGGNYVWDGGTPGATDADRTFITPGTYTVTVTTANGCTDTESITIIQNIIDPVAGINNNTGTTELTCVVTSISVTATGGGTYAWDGGTAGATDAERTFTSPGTYTVTVTSANGCSDIESITIIQDIVNPVAGVINNTGSTELTCIVSSINVTATGGGEFVWDGGTAGATDADRTFTSPGTYTVTVTSSNGCSDTESITITQDIVDPVAGIINNTGATELTCAVASINVTATGGVSYLWDGGTAGATDADRGFTSPGTYTVTVTAANGCTDTESITISQNILDPVAIIVNNTGATELTCTITSINVTATGGGTYSWDGGVAGATDADRVFTSPGTFTVTVTASNGCTDTESIIITQSSDIPVAVITNNTGTAELTCAVTSISVSASGGVSYSWDGGNAGGTDADRIFSSPGTYTVTVTASNGCTNTESITITQNIIDPVAIITNNTGATELTCTVTTINVTATGGGTYSWDGGVAGATDADRVFTSPGTYTVTVTASNGCTDTEIITITQNIIDPVAIINNNTGTTELTCTVTSISVNASGGVSYSWDGGSAGATDADRIFTSPGTYTVTVTTENGCSDTESIIITQDITDPVAVINNNTGTTELTCTVTSISVTASGGISYIWDGGSAGNTDAERIFTIPGTYTVTVTSTNGCTDVESIILTQNINNPVAGIINNTGVSELTCSITSINVTATGGGTYSWDGGVPGATDADRTFTTPGTYTVTITSANGCTDTESIIITQDIVNPVAGITNNTGATELTCTVTSISVTATGGGTYAWDGGTAGITDADRTFTTPGTFTVTVTSPNGCTDTESIIITQDIINPVAGITNNTGTSELTCTVTSISVSASGGVAYSWDGGTAGTSDADRMFTSPGTFTVTVIGANGCTDTESIIISQNIANPVAGIINNTGSSQLTCTVSSIDVSATGGGTYSWDGGSAGVTDADRVFNSPGTYMVTVTDVNGCTDTEIIVITQDLDVPVAGIINNTGTTELTCSTTSIEVTATGAGSYSWSGGTAGATQTERIFTVPGTYYLTVTADNGCSDIESISITQNITEPAAGITNNTGLTELTCSVTSISVTASGGIAYSWDGGTAGVSDADRVFTSPGTYTVTVTGANGCTDTESIIITQDIVYPVAGINNPSGLTELTCTVSEITFIATGSGSYSWNAGNAGVNPGEWIVNTPGTYLLTVTSSNGCADQAQIVITQNINIPQQPIVNVVHPTCTESTGSITITSPSESGMQYSIGGSYQSSPIFSGLVPATYEVTALSANGCESPAATFVINEQPPTPDAPVVTVTDNCDGSSTLVATNYTGTLLWNTGSTANPLYVGTAGYYQVTQTVGPCTSASSSPVLAQPKTVPPAPTVDVVNNVNGTTTLTAVGYTGTLLWSTGETSSSITVAVNGVYSVTQTVNGCTSLPGYGATSLQVQADPAVGAVYLVNNVDAVQNANTLLFSTEYSVRFPVYNLNQLNMVPAGSTTLKVNLGSKFILDPSFVVASAPLSSYFSWTAITVSGDLIITGVQIADIDADYIGLASFDVLGSSSCASEIKVDWLIDNNSNSVLFSDNDLSNNYSQLYYNLPVTINAIGVDVTCKGANNGYINWTTSPGTVIVITNALNQIVTPPLAPGTYKVTAFGNNDNSGVCSNFAMVTIVEPALSLVSNVSGTTVSCFGGSNGTVSTNVSGGTAPYTYVWNTTPAQTTATATGLAAGTYIVTVTDAKGCTAVSSYSVTQPSALTAPISATNISCFNGSNGSVTVTPVGGTLPYNYSWQGYPLVNGQVLTGISAGNYSVIVTDANGCSASASINVNQPATPLSSTATGTNINCFGNSTGSATVLPAGGTPGYTYVWNTVPEQYTANIFGLSAGTYSVTVTDMNGCTSTASYEVTEPAAALSAVASGTDLTCYASDNGFVDVSVSGGTAPYSYSWNTNPVNTNQSVSGLPAGTYTVTVTDSKGCVTTAFKSITQPALISYTGAFTNVSCNGESDGTASVFPTGGVAPYSYSWNTTPVQTTQQATGLPAGVYSVLITDAMGCLKSAVFIISEPAPLDLDITSNNVSCNGGNDGSATALATGGTGPYSYVWNTVPAQTSPVATGLAAGLYIVSISDSKGCNYSESFNITEPAPLDVEAIGTNVACYGNSDGTATALVTGGTAPYSYSWNTTPVQNTAIATGLATGSYSVTVTDSKGCSSQSTYVVTEPSAPLTSTISGAGISCTGTGNGSSTVVASGGVAPYSYSWNTVPVQTSASATGLLPGVYLVLITDANGCTTSNSYEVLQPAGTLTLTLSGTAVSCYGQQTGSVTTNVNGGSAPYSYSWDNYPLETGSSLSNAGAGLYSVLVTDANGCTAYGEYVVTQPAASLQTSISSLVNNICNGGNSGSISLLTSGGTAPYSYVWNTTPVQTGSTASGLTQGNYSVIVSDNNGCTTTVNASITQPAGIYPDITLGSDYTSNFFAAMNSENDIVYNVSEIGGNPATGDTIRIILPSGYEVEFDNAATSINIGGNNYLLDNSRWKLVQTNAAFVSIIFDPFGNNAPGTLYCGESVRVKVKLRRLTSTRSVFTLSSRLRRADGEVNLSNNLNSIIFIAE